MPDFWRRLIVALDVKRKEKIFRIIDSLYPRVRIFKIGLIPFTKFGPGIVKELVKKGLDIFLDLKFYDIPNIIENSVSIISQLGVWGFTIHIRAGREALLKAKAARERSSGKIKPLIFGVSELTSEKEGKKVLSLVRIASQLELDGVVASAREVSLIKKNFPSLKVITPGIRSKGSLPFDQKRIATAREAISRGADYIVVGRPIIEAEDYFKAARGILDS